MKGLFLLTALLGNFLSFCAAYGQSGAAERIMFYSGYLAEELMSNGFSIAPGCTGSRAGGRCTFDEFMRYVWAPFPEKGDTVRPTDAMNLLDAKTDFKTAKLATILQKMNGFKKAGMKKPITGNIDAKRLFPGSSDYYEAMRKCGGVVQTFRTAADSITDDAKKTDGKNILARAKEASGMVVDIRGKEMDNNEIKPRIDDLEKRLGFKLERKPGRDSTGRLGAYTVWDPVASIDKNPDKASAIMQAYTDWRADPADNNSNMRHISAFQSAKSASAGCGC